MEMKSTSRHKPDRKTICPQCNQAYLGTETGSVKLIIAKLIDKKAIIKITVCSMECAAQFIDQNKK
jgi:hypothetical protein